MADPLNQPHVIVIAGPNGAGKSTAAPSLLSGALGIVDFVNADVIAAGLSAFNSEKQAIEAGRLMLRRLRELAQQRATFAFETTLASRSFAPWIGDLIKRGYEFHLYFLSLPTEEHAAMRVRQRVREGGHDIPEATIRRRFHRGIANLLSLYRPLATTWRVYDNSYQSGPRLVASGGINLLESITERAAWENLIGQSHE